MPAIVSLAVYLVLVNVLAYFTHLGDLASSLLAMSLLATGLLALSLIQVRRRPSPQRLAARALRAQIKLILSGRRTITMRTDQKRIMIQARIFRSYVILVADDNDFFDAGEILTEIIIEYIVICGAGQVLKHTHVERHERSVSGEILYKDLPERELSRQERLRLIGQGAMFAEHPEVMQLCKDLESAQPL